MPPSGLFGHDSSSKLRQERAPAFLGLLSKYGTVASICLVMLSSASCASKWKITGPLTDARAEHTATTLPDGTVLVAGGYNETTVLASTERYNPASGVWTRTAPMNVPRSGHTATLLPDGTVLVAGGFEHKKDFYPIDSTERYNPATNTWTLSKPMHLKRGLHLAILLSQGRVLLIGCGPNQSVNNQRSVELYDAASDSWTQMSPSKLAHTRGSANLQLDGTVVVAGGAEETPTPGAGISMVAYSERYDPASNTWSEIALLNESPYAQTATVINDGTILLVGGRNTGQTYKGAIRYQPQLRNGTNYQSNLWQQTADMITARSNHQENLLANGTVIVTGGFYGCVDLGPHKGCGGSLAAVESFTPSVDDSVNGAWTAQDEMFNERGDHTATVVTVSQNDCRLMVAGGFAWDFSVGQRTLNQVELFPVPCPRPSGPLRR